MLTIDRAKAFAGWQAYLGHVSAVAQAFDQAKFEPVAQIRDAIAHTAEQGGTVWVAGNGGSGTVADHLALGLTLNALREGGQPVRAVSLGGSGAVMSGAANDFGYAGMFSAQLHASARAGDLFIGLSASGSSENVAAAMRTARDRGLDTAAIVGKPGPVSTPARIVADVGDPSAAVCEDVTVMLLHWLYCTFMGGDA